nr:hypothetical protein [Tanacetum cinerariifolium]
YEAAFSAVKSSSARPNAVRRFSSEKKPEMKDQKRIRELEKAEIVLHLILWGPK